MKPPASKRILSTIALLFASALLLPHVHEAQSKGAAAAKRAKTSSATRMTDKNLRDKKNKGGIEAAADMNFSLELTPGYISAVGVNVDKFAGGSISLAYWITGEDKIQIETGFYKSNNYTSDIAYTRYITYNGHYYYTGTPILNIPGEMDYAGTAKAKATAIPLLLSYSFCPALGSSGRFQLRFSAVAGIISFSDTWSVNADGLHIPVAGIYIDPEFSPNREIMTGTDSLGGKDSNKIVYTIGMGIGFTYNISNRLYLEAGYRYLWTTTFHNPMDPEVRWNGIASWSGLNANTYTLTLGWRF